MAAPPEPQQPPQPASPPSGPSSSTATNFMQHLQQQQQQPANSNAPTATAATTNKKEPKKVDYELVRKYGEYYSRVFPAEDICSWLQYGGSAAYLTNREFCLTLPGDIFCRFKTYNNPAELRRALMKDRPEKIDVGAVYQVPAEKKNQIPLVPQERELVFDIDMSDYDNIRSCCKGKQICEHCWPWMSTAAKIIRVMVEECFDYHIMMPVFSGRRGLHVWVCDAEARKLKDDERQAIVQHMTVITGSEGKLNCAYQLKKNALHPALKTLFGTTGINGILNDGFRKLFLDENNKNCLFKNSDSADIFREALDSVITQLASNSNDHRNILQVWEKNKGAPGTPIEKKVFGRIMDYRTKEGTIPLNYQQGLILALLYPRLDEKVSMQTNHLLKLPLCVHPGTGRLCCPLEFDSIGDFHPVNDPPKLDEMLKPDFGNKLPEKWMKPLRDCIEACLAEKKERDSEAEETN